MTGNESPRALWRCQGYSDAMALPVRERLRGAITHNVSSVHFRRDQKTQTSESVGTFRPVKFSSGLLRELFQKVRTSVLFRGSQPAGRRVKEANGKQFNVGAGQGFADITLGHATRIVAAVRENHNCSSKVPGVLQMSQGNVDGVEQTRAPLRLCMQGLLNDFLRVAGERHRHLRGSGELEKKRVVSANVVAEKGRDSMRNCLKASLHAAAGIDKDAERNGPMFDCEAGNPLFGSVLEQAEVLPGQVGDGRAKLRGHQHRSR